MEMLIKFYLYGMFAGFLLSLYLLFGPNKNVNSYALAKLARQTDVSYLLAIGVAVVMHTVWPITLLLKAASLRK
jgi:hypothetical protein